MFPDIDDSDENNTFILKHLSIKKFIMPDDSDELSKYSIMYENLYLQEFTSSLKDVPLYSIKEVTFHASPYTEKTPLDYTFKIDSFYFDPIITSSLEVTNVMNALKLSHLKGNLYIKGSMDLHNTGNFNIDEYAINLKNAGTLKGSVSFSGVTLDTLKIVNELDIEENKQNASQTKIDELTEQLLKQIILNNFNLQYEDNGLFNNVIEYNATIQEVTPKDLKDIIKTTLPAIANELNSPDFSKELNDATISFIEEPNSLELTIKPEKSISFQTLVMAAEENINPINEIIKLMNMHISANQ